MMELETDDMPPLHPLPWRPYPEATEDERLARAEAFCTLMRGRQSCRDFSAAPVPRSIIEAAIAAAGSAPSGANRQPWHFCAVASRGAKTAIRVAIEEEERRFYGGQRSPEWLGALRAFGGGPGKPYLETAPWLIVAFGETHPGTGTGSLIPNPYMLESVGIAVGLLLATLHSAGVATLVHTAEPAAFLNRLCRRPAQERPLMLIVAGLPAEDATVPAESRDKKPLERIASWL